MNERKYIGISIKHSIGGTERSPKEPKDGRYTLWGYGPTADDEKRCFSGYTSNADKCEIYSLEDFQKSYGNSYIKCDEPVKMCATLCEKYKQFDTVLVDIDDYKAYLEVHNGRT